MRHARFDAISLQGRFAILLLALLAVSAIPIAARAETEGRACAAEPTDEDIAYGDTITCAISPLGDSDVFRFAGTAGEHVFVTTTRSSGNVSPCIQLFRPSGGAPFASSCTSAGTTFTVAATLDEAGPWTISIADGGAPNGGSYTLVLDRLWPAPPTAEPLDYGATIAREITPIGDVDLFVLGGGLGSTITVQSARLDGTVQPCLALYDPDGEFVASHCPSTGNAFSITTTIDKAGTHVLHVADRGNNGTGPYSLTLQCISGECPNLHTLVITAGPAGAPNPVRSAGTAVLDVTAIDSFAHALTYAWAASCPAALGSNGAFSDASAQSPTWTAPANPTAVEQTCTIQVTVDDGHGAIRVASYEQRIYPVLPPDITVTPLALDFGSVAVGTTSAAQSITVKNDGLTDDLLISSITLTGTAFLKASDGCSNTALAPGQSCTVSVIFRPSSTGAKSSTLSIPSNDPDASENPVKVALSGNAVSGAGLAPDITVTPLALDFGSVGVGTASAAQVVTVANDGTADLKITGITTSTTAFKKTADGCSNATLTPGQSCTVSVFFQPATTGAKSATLSIPSNDPDEDPVKVALSGTGATGGGGGPAPDITATPLAVDFGSVVVNVASTAQVVTVTNDGAGDLLVKGITISGTPFKKTADGCSNTTLAPGLSCTVSVAFQPGSTGLKTGTLSIPSNDPDASENPVKVALSGTGVTGGGGGSAPDITVTPLALDFGIVGVNVASTAQVVTVANDGAGDLLVKGITLSGTAFKKTADGCSNTTLAPGQSCTVSVVFQPGSAGLKTGTLSVPSDDPDASENPVKVALSGTGSTDPTVTPDITVTPLALEFGGTAVGVATAAQVVTVTNDGALDLLVKGITVSGTAFQKTADGCSNTTLAPGQFCTVSVFFKPGSTGLKTSTLSIPSNDPDSTENPARVALSGTGL